MVVNGKAHGPQDGTGLCQLHIRVLKMVEQMESKCEAVCPKEISLNNMARMNRDQICAKVVSGS